MDYEAATTHAAAYGYVNTNPLTDDMQATRERIDHGHPYELSDPALVKITRLRLLGDPGPYAFPFFDVSYCYGELADGTPVRVNLPQWQFPKRGVRGHIIAMCREAGRYGKGLGITDDDVLSICM